MAASLSDAVDFQDMNERVEQVFGRFRKDEKRTFLTRLEVQKLFNELVPSLSFRQVSSMCNQIDGEGGDGRFTHHEFMSWILHGGGSAKDRSAVMKAIVDETGSSLVARVREIFDRFDADGNGLLERAELKKVFRTLDPDLLMSEEKSIMSEIDTSGDGRVSYREFVAWMKKAGELARRFATKLKQVTGEARDKRIKQAFERYDTSGDGLLDMQELHRVLSGLFLFNSEEVRVVCDDLGASRDRVVTLKEFDTWIKKGRGPDAAQKGKAILAPADSEGLEPVFYVFCGPGKITMGMREFLKFCKDCKLLDGRLTPTAAELVFNDHRVKAGVHRSIDLFEWEAALELLAQQKGISVKEIHEIVLLKGGPELALPQAPPASRSLTRKGHVRTSSASRRPPRPKSLVEDKEGWKRDVDNSALWKRFGVNSQAGRVLKRIYSPMYFPELPSSPRRSVSRKASSSLSAIGWPDGPPQQKAADGGGMSFLTAVGESTSWPEIPQRQSSQHKSVSMAIRSVSLPVIPKSRGPPNA
eukprot:TRINITY_DN91133_c0_g1_i1.p1 TRINITY_DN91133_c0_g1~~TRINITY_DN91133_c0_g1_i1.p1  ORF type:complete len:528 (+),score=117.60 TRINITY_DN91133_c0_g1_i1:101-1684(+)